MKPDEVQQTTPTGHLQSSRFHTLLNSASIILTSKMNIWIFPKALTVLPTKKALFFPFVAVQNNLVLSLAIIKLNIDLD